MEPIIGNNAPAVQVVAARTYQEVSVPRPLDAAAPDPNEAALQIHDVVADPQEDLPAPLHLLPPPRHFVEDALEYIFGFINGIHDEQTLHSIWIRSDTPYRIKISLRMLKDTLFVRSASLHPDCFNLAVRKLASAEVERHAGTNMVGGKHYFDLQFHAQSRALRYSWMPQGQCTSTLINNAVLQAFPRYDVFNSTIYLLPLSIPDSSYGLLVDPIMLRSQVVVQMLMVKDNLAAGNIPQEITVALRDQAPEFVDALVASDSAELSG
ncbi:hypothetical protein TRIUR3_05567 [Triticum urartu]|uniref:Uncharacterized protein n=1 Tax=Triticum urartu TaxID=4572 RepID=M7ZUL8_TRIUA|nr:hypothetical protein TRIUR3_05567 [Triticum urartu]